MQNRSAVLTLTTVSLMFLCLLQGAFGDDAQIRRGPRSRIDGDALTGEWRVNCSVSVFEKGALKKSRPDDADSLVVVESDQDGSYELYKFPLGFGEGFPRLRRVSANQYAGDDTVHGIATLVTQRINLVEGRITIKQAIIDAASRHTLSETLCTGSRLQSARGIPATNTMAEICPSIPAHSKSQDRKLTRRFATVRPFSDGLAAAAITHGGSRAQKWGFIDMAGRVVIPMRYDEVTSFLGELAAAGKLYGHGRNLKWSVVEKMGPQVTPHVNYDAVKILGEGFAAVGYAVPGAGLKWNLINRENTTILYGFDDIGCFVGGRARATLSDGNAVRTGYVDRVGDFFPDKE